jgi:hypothetical protein
MKLRTVALLGCLLLASAVALPPANAGCLKCKVKGYVDAVNANDSEKALSFFAESVRFVSPRSDITLDKQAIAEMLGWDIATQAALAHGNLEGEGDTVRGHFTERSELYELLGIDERSYELTVRFDGGQIREIRSRPLPTEGPTLDEALQPFLTWAEQRHADVLDEIYPQGRFVYSEAAARRWLSLLRQWKAG